MSQKGAKRKDSSGFLPLPGQDVQTDAWAFAGPDSERREDRHPALVAQTSQGPSSGAAFREVLREKVTWLPGIERYCSW